jgi:hypothetical protein
MGLGFCGACKEQPQIAASVCNLKYIAGIVV